MTQTKKMVAKQVWTTGKMDALYVAAYNCAYQFGKFDKAKHKKGYLTNVLSDIVSKDYQAERQTEISILKKWQELCKEQKANTEIDTIKNCLLYANEHIKQYGSVCAPCMIIAVNGKSIEKHGYLCVKADTTCVVDVDRNVIFEEQNSKSEMQCGTTELDYHVLLKTGTVRVSLKCETIHTFKLLVDAVKGSKYPTRAEAMVNKPVKIIEVRKLNSVSEEEARALQCPAKLTPPPVAIPTPAPKPVVEVPQQPQMVIPPSITSILPPPPPVI